jgi:hypothetical protein
VDDETHSELFYSIYDPNNGRFVKTETLLATGLEYYTYGVQYLESIDRFLAVAAYEQGGDSPIYSTTAGQSSVNISHCPSWSVKRSRQFGTAMALGPIVRESSIQSRMAVSWCSR